MTTIPYGIWFSKAGVNSNKTHTKLDQLPGEIHALIAPNLTRHSDILNICLTNKALHRVYLPLLYRKYTWKIDYDTKDIDDVRKGNLIEQFGRSNSFLEWIRFLGVSIKHGATDILPRYRGYSCADNDAMMLKKAFSLLRKNQLKELSWEDYGRLDACYMRLRVPKAAQRFPLVGYDLLIQQQKQIQKLNLYDSTGYLVEYAEARKTELGGLKNVKELSVYSQTSSEVIEAAPIFAAGLPNLKEISIYMHRPTLNLSYAKQKMEEEGAMIRFASTSQFNRGPPQAHGFVTEYGNYIYNFYPVMATMSYALLNVLHQDSGAFAAKIVKLDIYGAFFDNCTVGYAMSDVTFPSLRHLALLQCGFPGPLLDKLRDCHRLRHFEYSVAEYRVLRGQRPPHETYALRDFLKSSFSLEKIVIRTDDSAVKSEENMLDIVLTPGFWSQSHHLRVLMLSSESIPSYFLENIFDACKNIEVLSITVQFILTPLLMGQEYKPVPANRLNGKIMCGYLEAIATLRKLRVLGLQIVDDNTTQEMWFDHLQYIIQNRETIARRFARGVFERLLYFQESSTSFSREDSDLTLVLGIQRTRFVDINAEPTNWDNYPRVFRRFFTPHDKDPNQLVVEAQRMTQSEIKVQTATVGHLLEVINFIRMSCRKDVL